MRTNLHLARWGVPGTPGDARASVLRRAGLTAAVGLSAITAGTVSMAVGADPSAPALTALPARITAGTCDEPGDERFALRQRQGPEGGDQPDRRVHVSISQLEGSLDALADGGGVLVVGGDAESPEAAVACGSVEASRQDPTFLAVELAPRLDSGYAGTALFRERDGGLEVIVVLAAPAGPEDRDGPDVAASPSAAPRASAAPGSSAAPGVRGTAAQRPAGHERRTAVQPAARRFIGALSKARDRATATAPGGTPWPSWPISLGPRCGQARASWPSSTRPALRLAASSASIWSVTGSPSVSRSASGSGGASAVATRSSSSSTTVAPPLACSMVESPAHAAP